MGQEERGVMSTPDVIPNKLYFSISEVAEITGVKPHVLRYWESEFPELRPRKNRAGNRSYRERDIRMVMTIRDLLYQQGFTIQGARQQIRDRTKRDDPDVKARSLEALRLLKRELQELKKRLD